MMQPHHIKKVSLASYYTLVAGVGFDTPENEGYILRYIPKVKKK